MTVERDFQRPGRSTVYAANAAVATSHPIATETAIRVLRSGGNAVDAAVAAAAVLCVAEPHNTGIGGDCFAIIAEPDGKLHGINGSGRSSRGLTLENFRERPLSKVDPDSVHAVTVPGAVQAWAELLKRHGRWGLDRAVAPAIDLAESGCPVAPRVAFDWAKHVARLAKDAGSAKYLLWQDRSPKAGDIYRNKPLARALRRIAEAGPSGFYRGPVAEDIVRATREKGGLLDLDDLAACRADWESPILTDYRGLTVAELPPNGQGVTALVLLNILEAFDLASLDPLGDERAHIEIEASRLAYTIRDRIVADPEYLDFPVERILAKEFADGLARLIDTKHRQPSLEGKAILPSGSDTICLSVVDQDGRAVSFINSLYMAFGSAITTFEFGITLQNRGACFVVASGHPNCVGPSKRPLHTIIPAVALSDGKPSLAFGVMGGAYQACGHARLVSNLVDYGMSVQSAIDAPRSFWDNNGVLGLERSYPSETLAGLRSRGHEVQWAEMPWGGAQVIRIDHARGILEAGSDPRKDGAALGF